MNNQDNQQNNKEKSKGQKSRFLRFFKIFGIVVISIVAFLFLAFLGLKSLLVYVDETTVDMQDECNLGCYAKCHNTAEGGYDDFKQSLDNTFSFDNQRKKNTLVKGEDGYIDCLNDFKIILEKYLNDKTTPDFRIDEVKKEVEYRERYLKEEIPKHLKE